MQKVRETIKRHWLLLPILIIIVFGIAGLSYLTGVIGTQSDRTRLLQNVVTLPTISPLSSTPIARFAQIDPAIIEVVNMQSSEAGQAPAVLGIQPVGVYLPHSGNAQLELVQPTDTPTPLPFPTSPPLPTPVPILPTPLPPPTNTLLPPTQTPIPPAPPPLPTQPPAPSAPPAILPTLVPPLTSTPLPPPSPTAVPPTPLPPPVLPTPESVDDPGRVESYAGDGCAPAGNPVAGVLTQRYHAYHGGIDLGVPLNTPVLATHSGTVLFADWSAIGYGFLVIVQNGRFMTYYAHNTSFNVQQGEQIGKGTVVAWSGSTGNSNGPHVHYETRIDDVPVDPLTFSSRGFGTC